ncbi:DUF5801 repeats-in-toxin domain-containing protein [Afipia clevelandensis]|uniref:T1SS-143 repeat domain-containing protein n=1 Tax=Afipia clevelandensis ATCC 49720 TaxID=883079 RepID=K8PNK9_9BRAD|nr:DUF5801 repeats-in-toxin domain-containing protein [Afipia clevelandensis]EKS39948.1 T1SS-143 repeat domain-containing protein [Afipia clevelandensis ATCC 49720]
MNAPVLLAQLSGSTQAPPPKTLKIEKPANAQALSFHLDGNTRLDFSDIASEKLTFVKVGEKLIVLFDNQSTVTIDPVFDSASGNPLADIGFQVGDRTLDGTEFAALFPIGTDQSVLPAAGGNASGPTGGANFSDAQVNGLGPGGNPLALLGDEQFGGPEFGNTEPGLAQIGVGTAVVGEIDDEGLSEGIEGGPGDAPGNATSVVNASLNLNFGALGTSGATLAFLTAQPELSGLTSGGEPINLVISNPAGGTPTIIGFVGLDPNAPGSHVFEITLGLTTNTGEYSFTLLRPLDHPEHGTEDTIALIIHYSATNAAGTVFPDFTVNVNDDSPDLNPDGFDLPVSLGDSPVPHADLKDPASGTSVRGGTLGVLWGADNFNNTEDGGVSQTTGQNGDRSLIFTNTTVNLSSGETSLASDLYSHGEQVHFVLQENGTLLVGYTGDSPTSESTVFTVKLHDTNTGSYVFTQYQELDHVGSSGEGQPVNLDALDLSFNYTATDSDGDSINESFSVTVGDDAPTINANGIQDGAVDEDYLANGNDGDTYAQPPAPGTGDFKFSGNLGVSWGADDNNTGSVANRSLSFSNVTEGAAATDAGGNAISSHDQAVLLHLTTIGGQPALVGYTGADADNQSNWVFTVRLDDSTSTGSYTFTLLQPLDHPTSNAEDNIQIDVGFTATDADGDTASSTFHVTINDDAPIQTGETITGTAAEDDLADFNPLYPLLFDFWQGSLGTSPYDGAGDNSHTGLLGTVPVWGNLSSLVKPGADGPGEFHLVSESQAESVLAHLGPNGGTLSSHGDVINDVRMVDIPNVGEAMGFFASDGRLVFGLLVTEDGTYNFRLFDQIDHPVGDDPNTAALESVKDTLNIDLSQLVTYTDFDKDTITLSAGTFSVNVVDDAPVVVGHEAVTANENDLANFNPLYPLVFDFWQGSLGSSPFDGATDDSSYTGLLGTVTAWGTLADNVRGGADEFGKFELVSETRANELLATLGAGGGPLMSHGDAIDDARLVDIPGLGEVMGFFASDGRLVFGLLVTENGTYNFRLFDQLDHAAPAQDPNAAPIADENSLDIDLSKFVTYSDYDHDTVDLGTGTFVVTVVDDIPHVIGSLTVTLDESHLNNFLVGWDLIPAAIKDLYPVEGSSGTNPNADTDLLLNTTSQQGFLDEVIGNNVVHGGADEFGKFGVVSENRADGLLEGMGIMSKGEAIDHVKLVDIAGLGTVMGFFAGDRVVFTLTVTDAGFYDLRLFDQVDHTGANGTSLNIDLSKFVTYTDFDGDVIDLGTSNLVLTVLDDAPVPVTGAQVFGTVEEEQYNLLLAIAGNEMAHGNEDLNSDSGDDHDTSGLLGDLVTSNVSFGSLSSLVKIGADENGTFSFDQSIRGIAVVDSTGAAVRSHGQAVTFGFTNDGQLIGIANDDGDGILETGNGERVVFSVSLADINPLDNVNNDLFTFTLLDQIDHNDPNGLSTEDLKNLDLSKAIRFTDFDGDSTGFGTNSFQIKVIDDTPRQTGTTLKGTVEEEENVGAGTPEMNHGNEDTANEPLFLGFIDQTSNKATGNLGSLVSVGGDEVSKTTILGIPVYYGTFSFGQTADLPVVMSKGEQVLYTLSDTNGDGLNDTLTGSTSGGRPVFTLTIVNNTGGGKTAGDYVFTLLDQIDHPAGGGENIANIDFSSVIRFSDFDGDTITLASDSFSIDVIDDQPVSKGDVTASDVLDDEGQSIFTPVNTGGTGDISGQKTVAQGGAKSLFSIGADDLGTITVTDKPSFSVLFANDNGFAQAESVQWHDPVTAADGTVTLTAYSDHYATVATLVIKIDGSYSFTMSAPVVHPTNQSNEEEVSLKFKYTVTDFDQDSVTGSLTIKVDDDTPKLTTPSASGQLDDEAQSLFPANNNTVTGDVTNTNVASGTANTLFTAGADGVTLVTATPTTFSVIFKDANGLAGTEAVTWSSTGVQGPNGETKWIATSSHYDADHPAATLIIRVDGSYSFTLNAPVKNDTSSAISEENLTITIPFKVTDGDGDQSSQGTLTIKVNDDTPTVGTQTAITVDEEGLGGNPGDTYASTNPHDAATSLASSNGTLNYSYGSDGASPTTNVTFLTSNLSALGLKSEGLALTYAYDQASHTLTASNTNGTVFTLQVTDVLTGAYTFTMSRPLDHLGANSANSEDDITIPFQFTITDGDGDTSTTATVNVTINDDAPTFTAGSVENKTVDEEGINGNPGAPAPYAGSDYAGEATTASGGLGISWGADNGNSGAANRSLAFNGITEGAAVLNDANVAITSHGAAVKYHLVTVGDTQTLVGYTGNDANNTANYVFSVTLDDTTTTGTYNFTLFKNLDHPIVNSEDDISIKFNFTAKDADKDSVTGSFKVTVDDDSPIITLASVQNGGVDEDNLAPNGNHDSAPGDLADDGTLVAHGSLGISYGADGPGVGAAANPGVTKTFDFTNHSTNIDPYLTVNAHFGVVGNAPVGALGGGQNAPVVITAANGHPFELDSVKLSFAGGPSLVSKITVIAKDVGGQTYTFDVAVQNVFNLDGSTPTTFDTTGSPIDGKQLVSVSFGVYGNQAAYVQVDDVVMTRGAAPEVPGPVYFSDLGNAAANITVTDSNGNTVALNQLTSNGQALHFVLLDSVTLVGYTGSAPSSINAANVVFSTVLSGTGSGSYDFTLKGVLDHPLHSTEDDLVFTFNYTAKDFDGDTTSSTFKVTVDDDMPVIVTPAAGENLIVNGQFTDNAGFAPPMSWGGQAAPANSDIKGWHIANNNLERNPANWYVQDPADGGRVVDLDATPGNVSLSQTFANLQNGQSYTLTFDAAKPAGYDATTQVYWNGQLVGTITPNSDHFEQFSIVVIGGAGSNTLEFREVGIADNGGTFLANVAMYATNAIVNEDSLNGGNAGGLGDATGTTASAIGSLGVKWGADAGDVTDAGNVQDGTAANALSDNVATLTGRAVYFADSNSGVSGLQPSVTAFVGASAITLHSAGQEVHYQILENGTKLVGYTGAFNAASQTNWVFTVSLSDEGTGQYTFNLLKPLDHPMSGSEDDINLTFGFTARDADGDTADSTLTITVDDDTPVLVGSADTITVDETNTPLAQSDFGSLHVSMGADKGGAVLSFATDSNGVPLHPAGLTSDGTPLDYELRTTQYGEKQLVAFKHGATADDPVFIVALSSPANPTYIFTLFQNLDHAEGSNTLDLNFTIRVTDGDGDFVDRTVDVTVKDSVPTIPATTEQVTGVQDDALTGGNPEPGDTKTASGTLSHSFGADENGHLSWLNPTLPATGDYSSNINGNTLEVYQLQNAVNVKVFTVTLDPATGDYTITQIAPIHHPSGNGENSESFDLNYRVTDGDTDYVDSHLKVIVGDDIPVITGPTTSVNLLTNGDFTGGSFPHTESWGHWATDGTGWKISGTEPGQTGVQLELIQSGYLGVVTSNGHPMVDLAATPGDVAISQTLNGLAVGEHYTLSFEIGASAPSSAGLKVYWNGNPVGTYHPGQTTAIETLDLTAIAGANTITFEEIGSPDNTGTYLANVSLVQASAESMPVFHANIGEDAPSIITFANGADFNFGADGPGAVTFDTAHATITTPAGTTLGLPTLSYDPVTGNLTVDPAGNFNSLSAGEIATLTVPFTVTDSDGDTVNGIYQFTITGSNDGPVISGSEIAARVFEAGGLNSVVTADVASDHRFEPLRNVDSTAAHSIDAGVDTAANMKTVVLAVQTALGTGTTMADAIASVWDYLDDLRQSIPDVDQAYYAPLINKATVLLGLVYGEYLQNGGRPLLDVIVKYTPDSGDDGSAPDRFQSLHDNLLGAVDTPSIDDKFSSDPTLLADLKAQILAAGLTDRPIYSGNEGVTNNALGWDLDPLHGFLHASSGQLSATDVDGDALTWSITNTSSYGSMSIDQTGKWTYVLDNGLVATQALAEGETKVETFTATVTDSHGAIDTQTITITIVGTNDAPVASVDSEAISDTSAVDAGAPITFTGHNVLANDTDIDSMSGFAVISIRAANPIGQGAQEPPITLVGGEAIAHGTYGNLTMHADGTYTYTPNAAFDSIPQGQSVTDVFKYGMIDDHGASSASFLTITITGTNDGATITGTGTGDVMEDGAVQMASGTLTVNDVDTGDNHFQTPNPVLLLGTYGTFTFNALSGAWTYTLDNSAPNVQALKATDTVHDTLTVVSNDGTASQTIDITIYGTNDAPIIDSHSGVDLVSLSVAENTTAVTTVHASDIDSPTITYTIDGGADAALFTVNSSTGALSFINAPDFENPIDAGHDNHYNVTVKASDGALSDTQAFDIAVTNVAETPHLTANDDVLSGITFVGSYRVSDGVAWGLNPPVYSAAQAAVLLFGGAASDYLISTNNNAATITATGWYDGWGKAWTAFAQNFSQDAAPAGYNLPNGDAWSAYVSDHTDYSKINYVWRFNGNALATEDQGTITFSTGLVLANDIDLSGHPLTVTSVSSAVGGSVSVFGGSISFTLDANFYGQASFEYTVSDGFGNTDTGTARFNVTGVNDAPVIDSHAGADLVTLTVAENTTAVTAVHATDPDGPTLVYSIDGGADAALFTVDGATGALSFINAPDFENPLDAGHDNHYSVIVKASDGTLFDTQAFDIAVTDVAETLPHTTITDASPYYAFSNSTYAASVSQPATINFDADNIFGGGSDTFNFTFTQVYNSGGTNWLTVNAAQGTVTGDPTNLSTLTVYRIDAVDTVTHEHTFTYVAFSALPDSNSQYVQITNSASYSDSWKSDVVQIAAGSTVPGNTVVSGASASDVLIGNDNANTLNGDNGNDALYGGGGSDVLYGGGNTSFLSGGAGNDKLYSSQYGGGDPKFMLGGDGDDQLYGGHDDILMGGAGNDIIVSGNGKNLIVGGEGNDTLTGGSNRDTYVFLEAGDSNADRITNYDNSTGVNDQDVIDLSYLLESVATDKASHVRFMYSDSGHTTHVLTDASALPAIDGDVTIQVNTTGTWQSVVTIADTGSNLTTGSNAIQMMLDHATVQQFHA